MTVKLVDEGSQRIFLFGEDENPAYPTPGSPRNGVLEVKRSLGSIGNKSAAEIFIDIEDADWGIFACNPDTAELIAAALLHHAALIREEQNKKV